MWIVAIVYVPTNEVTGSYAFANQTDARAKKSELRAIFKNVPGYRIDLYLK